MDYYKHEPLLCGSGRLAAFPIEEPALYELYKTAESSYWIPDEIARELAKDLRDWSKLPETVQHILKYILAFFAVSDGIVNENISNSITSRITLKELDLWYKHQQMMENIHNITYSKLVEAYFTNTERAQILDSIKHFPVIAKKIAFIKKYLCNNPYANMSHSMRATLIESLQQQYNLDKNGDPIGNIEISQIKTLNEIKKFITDLSQPIPSLAQEIFVNFVTEGVFFSGSFAFIFWIVDQLKLMPGLAKANEFISRDEALHVNTGATILNKYIMHELPESLAHTIMKEAVEIETECLAFIIKERLPNMNVDLMTQYIKFVADQQLILVKYKPIYNEPNPFPFMDKQAISVRSSDFFTTTVSEYNLGKNNETDELNFDYYD